MVVYKEDIDPFKGIYSTPIYDCRERIHDMGAFWFDQWISWQWISGHISDALMAACGADPTNISFEVPPYANLIGIEDIVVRYQQFLILLDNDLNQYCSQEGPMLTRKNITIMFNYLDLTRVRRGWPTYKEILLDTFR